MFNLINWLTKLVPKTSYQSSLEQYIASKNPESPADVEHWIRQFDQRKQGLSL